MNIKFNPKTIILTILGIFLLYFFVGIPVQNYLWRKDHKTISYVVLGKQSGIVSESTGKYSSEIVNKHYIRVRYDGGIEETIQTNDPFIADSYIVGERYSKSLGMLDTVTEIDCPTYVNVAIFSVGLLIIVLLTLFCCNFIFWLIYLLTGHCN